MRIIKVLKKSADQFPGAGKRFLSYSFTDNQTSTDEFFLNKRQANRFSTINKTETPGNGFYRVPCSFSGALFQMLQFQIMTGFNMKP